MKKSSIPVFLLPHPIRGVYDFPIHFYHLYGQGYFAHRRRVNPNGSATTYWFEYGTDAALATYSSTPTKSAGSSTKSLSFSEAISGLQAGTTYYFRVTASSGGTARGAINSFSTTFSPPPSSPGPWAKTYGGGSGDNGKYIQQTIDNGFIVAGDSEGKIWVLKLNADGTVLWQKSYSDINYNFTAVSIHQTLDGGFILGGRSGGYELIIKINGSGSIEWANLLWETLDLNDDFSIIQTSDGGYIFGWYGVYDGIKSIQGVLLLKLDRYGSINWQRSYKSPKLYTIFRIYGTDAIRQTNDGGYIVAGNNDYFNPRIMKINQNGDIIWHNLYSFGFSGRYSTATSILQETNGDCLFTGRIEGASRDEYNLFMIKIDSNGLNPIAYEYNGGVASSINKTTDGGYVIGGGKDFNSGPNYSIAGPVLLKIDQSGVPIWRHTYGTNYGSGYQIVGAYGIPTRDGGYVATGSYRSSTIYYYDIFVLKLPNDGNIAFNSSSQLFDINDNTYYRIWPVSTNNVGLISESANISFTSPNLISNNINVAINTQAP